MIPDNLCIKAVEVVAIDNIVANTVSILYDSVVYENIPVRICSDRWIRKRMKQGLFAWDSPEQWWDIGGQGLVWGQEAAIFPGSVYHFVIHGGINIDRWRPYGTDWVEDTGCSTVTPEAWAIIEFGNDDEGNIIIVGFVAVIGVKQHGSAWYNNYCFAGTNYETWEGYTAAYPGPNPPPNYKFYAAPTFWPYVEIKHEVGGFGKYTVYDLIRDEVAWVPTIDYTGLFRSVAQSSPDVNRGLWWGNGMIAAMRTHSDQAGNILANTFLNGLLSTSNLYIYYNSLDAPKSMRPVLVPYSYRADLLFDQL